MAHKIAYMVIHGHGYVTKNMGTSTVTGVELVAEDVPYGTNLYDIYDIETTFSSGYNSSIFDIEEEVGSRVIVSNFESARNVPDGEYTLIGYNSGNGRITIRIHVDAGSPTPTTGDANLGSMRIEDFFKFSNSSPPDFVTGENARSRWISNILRDGLELTIGRKIDVLKAGFASVDGLTIKTNYDDSPAFKELLQTNIISKTISVSGQLLATDRMDFNVEYPGDYTNAGYRVIYSDDTNVYFGVSNSLPGRINANNGSLFEFYPVWLNREAIIITGDLPDTNSSGRNVRQSSVIRGVLRTYPVTHAPATIVIDRVPPMTGRICQIIQIDSDAYSNFFEEEQFFGAIDNVLFENGFSEFKIEISDITITGFRQKFAAKLSPNISSLGTYKPGAAPLMYFDVDDIHPILSPDISRGSWQWFKHGKALYRLYDKTKALTNGTNAFVSSIKYTSDSDGVASGNAFYRTRYLAYPVIVNSNNDRLDDFYIIEKSEDSSDQDQYIYPKIEYNGNARQRRRFGLETDDVIRGENSYLVRKISDDGFYDGTLSGGNVFSTNVVKLDYEGYGQHDEKDMSLAHLFSTENIPDSEVDIAPRYPFGQAFLNLNLTSPAEKYIPAGILALQILTSGDGIVGGKNNGPFDVLPYNMGLGIPIERVYLESFGVYEDTLNPGTYVFDPLFSECVAAGADRWADAIFLNVGATVDSFENVAKWLTDVILKPLSVGITQYKDNNDLKYKVRAFELSKLSPRDQEELDSFKSINDDDLIYEYDTNLNVSSEINSENVLESVSFTYYRITELINEGNITYNQTIKSIRTFPLGGTDDTLTNASIYTYVQGNPIIEELKFPLYYKNDAGYIYGAGRLDSISTNRLNQFSNPTIVVKIVTEIDKDIQVGDKVSLEISNLIEPQTGNFGFSGFGYCIEQKTNILRGYKESTIITFLLAGLQFSLWAPSAQATGAVSGRTFTFETQIFTNSSMYTNDVSSFAVGDKILLYDQNFILRSENNGGLPDPREIDSINVGLNTITITSDFTDSSSSSITPNAGDIIVLAEKTEQNTQTQVSWGYMNDYETIWR
jgi:hypothetical protein